MNVLLSTGEHWCTQQQFISGENYQLDYGVQCHLVGKTPRRFRKLSGVQDGRNRDVYVYFFLLAREPLKIYCRKIHHRSYSETSINGTSFIKRTLSLVPKLACYIYPKQTPILWTLLLSGRGHYNEFQFGKFLLSKTSTKRTPD